MEKEFKSFEDVFGLDIQTYAAMLLDIKTMLFAYLNQLAKDGKISNEDYAYIGRKVTEMMATKYQFDLLPAKK